MFVLNFEVQKMFNKALTINNQKYTNIIYINSDMDSHIIENIITYLEKNYSKHITFFYHMYDKYGDFDNIKYDNIKKIEIE